MDQQLAGTHQELCCSIGSIVTVAGVLAPIFLALQAAAVAVGTSIGGLIAAALPIIAVIAAVMGNQ